MALSKSLSVLVYGASKCGKSTFGATGPYPRLMLDVEAGARFLPIQAVTWDPMRDHPPVADGTWDTCVVPVRDYDAVLKVYSWLQSGQHQFKSLTIDSISELQVKCIDNLVGADQMKMQDWGTLLRHMSGLLRDIRDLTMHPTNPLEAVVLTSMARTGQDGRFHPYLQGQVATIAPYLFDVIGFIRMEEFQHPDPTQGTYKVRRMYVESTNFAEAGERVQGRLGTVVEQADMDVTIMINKIYGESTSPPLAVVPASSEPEPTTLSA
jgi:hypothetical protein